ncbi:glycosyltransferase family 4 protein [Planotetraspora kaengkrachanensis]|uniref:Undecaprenyl-phosphate alpha-N-acetylglucosaminyl 1-phosphate transferase n=1 Tax=Planotetraspora kaengkrachanensis TaxID=575193 RepID=A0A8J3PVP1_9ACTN|nr:MraY family glycosyltransferase [Planotetraspora kaengkrachanensis]GIG81862.1 undecaprenyl-phosphate alpha-N-acetylglucosaminyl 1-phosphate transferase [Planotetraspora kaengkrachanensis]
MREYLLLALVAAAVTFLLVPPVRVFAVRIGAAPEVRERDVHKVPTPRLGGLAMFGGLVAGLLMANHLPYVGDAFAHGLNGQTTTALLAAGGLIVVTGFLDDWLGMDSLVKLGGQIGAGGLLVYFGMYLPWLPLPQFLGGSTGLDTTLRTVITIMIVVIVINAVNFVDGLDGLAAGIVGIAAMATFAYSIALSQMSGGSRINMTAAIAAILIGMCLGFLPHNFNPAKIFMGDTGSMLIGLLLATSLITITSSVEPQAVGINKFPVMLPLILPVAVMVLPLTDLILAVVRRTSAGRSPFAPDRGHLHHRLLDIGHSQRRSVLIMYAWTFLFASTIVGLSIGGVPLIVFPLTILFAVGVLVLMGLPRWRRQREEFRQRKAATQIVVPLVPVVADAAEPAGPVRAHPYPQSGGRIPNQSRISPPADVLVAGRPRIPNQPPAQHQSPAQPPARPANVTTGTVS